MSTDALVLGCLFTICAFVMVAWMLTRMEETGEAEGWGEDIE